jgi:potassium-transporting ATPase KdpC subunit
MRLLAAIRMIVVLTVLTGIAYPIVMTGIGTILFPAQARGSLIERNGKVVGSALIGQNFDAPGYFHGRPSAAGNNGYDATASGGSNLGPTNKALIATVTARVKSFEEKNPGATTVPVDLVTASGSGLDPEISPAAAEVQIARVAKARGVSEESVRDLVRANTRPRLAGVFGEPGVNVLRLNLALDRANPKPSGS